MGNSDLNKSENILVKTDSNNLIYIDPNSVVDTESNVQPRSIEPENLVVYVNLEADIVPRTILATPDAKTGKGRLISVAKGTLNFLRNQNGQDFDTTWTESFSSSITNDGIIPNVNDNTAQSFGIESININIKGWGIPSVTINFVDVRGKTLFESPKDSPYRAFFHLPWPIFYLTVKGYYGKAVRYKLHLASFTSKFNEGNGNFDITTTFIGSTYAYLSDIPFNGVMNAAYLYGIEKESTTVQNGKDSVTTKKISKSSKGYTLLRSIYDELKGKNLISKNFPVKTLREVITIAKNLDNILEREIFDQVANPKVFQGVRDVSKIIQNFYNSLQSWGAKYLSNESFEKDGVKYRYLAKNQQNKLDRVLNSKENLTLENILTTYQDQLKKNALFVETYMNKTGVDFKKQTFNLITQLQKVEKYIKQDDASLNGIAFDSIINGVNSVQKSFNSQKQKLEDIVEKRMNEIIKDPQKGFGFEPTIRNIFAVLLANADVYVRLLKDVHFKAFEAGQKRKQIIKNYTDETPNQNAIYPWPEIKKASSDSTQRVLAYPGDPDLIQQLQSNDANLWPEVDFIENYVEIATKKTDTLAEKEQGTNKINYIFDESTSDKNYKPISQFLELKFGIPYTNKSTANILYEIYERAVAVSTLEDFDNTTIVELANKEFDNIQESFQEDSDIIDTLKLIKTTTDLLSYMKGTSPFERFPYYSDKLPSVTYLQSIYSKSYEISSYFGKLSNIDRSSEYKETSNNITQFKPKSYRKYVYPYNSDEFLNYLNKPQFDFTRFDGNLKINTKDGFVSSNINPSGWVKTEYTGNIFNQKFHLGNSYVNILNTPYFHKQLFYDFNTSYNRGKYIGSAYLFLNSLPFYDLNDEIKLDADSPKLLMATLLKEVSSTHYIPYHLILKWGSIYHRYKRFILDGVDILTGFTNNNVTQPINGQTFFDNSSGTTFTVSGTTNITYSTNDNIGIHPFYDAIYHQVVNGYSTYDIDLGNSDFSGRTTEFIYRERVKNSISYWSGAFDNSITVTGNTFYTILPCDGVNDDEILGTNDNFFKDEQNNFKIIWTDNDAIQKNDIFSGKTINGYNQYLSSFSTDVNTNNERIGDKDFGIASNYRKVIDLIGTFEPSILDKFEEYFLNFASEKENVEIEFKTFPDFTDSEKHTHSVKYQNFQELLKALVTVKKESSDGSDIKTKLETIRTKQANNLLSVTKDILSYDNLIEIKLGNSKEINYNLFDGFSGIHSGNTFSYNTYDSITQVTPENLNFIKLYLGEDLDGRYQSFFSLNDVELSEDNILLFRPLIQIFAGWNKQHPTQTKKDFQKYIVDNILVNYENRTQVYLDQLTGQFSKRLTAKDINQNVKITKGYNISPVKLELYNYFKSYNDKWASGNSIGQRNLLEEFLFLDKANKDIGNIAYLSLYNLISLEDQKNDKLDLYSVCSVIIENSGFDMRAMPSYVNFYGTNFNSKSRISPSHKVAKDVFGTFLEVDYEESAPKVIFQYIGNNSKHPDLSDIRKDEYLYNDDSFYAGDTKKNPLIITLPKVYDAENLDKSNKVVAFEVSVGDQNQGLFKSIQIDQSTLKNTSESFPVLENIARSESGAATYQIDTGLYDYYRQASYSCEITMMGDVMIQPTMYFYLKNIPMFKGTYWITEVTHNIRGNKITTNFKGSRVPYSSLPNPKDSFVSSYRVLFDKITNKAVALLKQEQNTTNTAGATVPTAQNTTTETSFTTDKGTSVVDMGSADKKVTGENIVRVSDITDFGIPYNDFNNEKYIQKVEYNNNTYLRAQVVTFGGVVYNPKDDIEMSVLNRANTKTISGGSKKNKILWKDIKNSKNLFYASKFDLNSVNGDKIISGKTVFLNPKNNLTKEIEPITDNTITPQNMRGPVHVGPNINGYGMAMSPELKKSLKLEDGDVVYFNII